MSTGDHPVVGQPGQYLVTANNITISSGMWGTTELNTLNNKELGELKERIESIEERLAIVIPSKELQARFPALQEAYDHYKLIEKLVNDKT